MKRWTVLLPPSLVGVALGTDHIWAVRPGSSARTDSSELWSRPLDAPPRDGAWDDLAEALHGIRETLQLERGALAIALLPPLVQARLVTLPRLRPDERRRILTRDAGRYFLEARESLLADGTPREGRASPASVLAAAAPARIIELVLGAAAAAGWGVDTIVPAEAVWEVVAGERWSDGARRGMHLVLPLGDRTEILHLAGGRIRSIRRVPAGTRAEDVIEDSSAVVHVERPEPLAALSAGSVTGPELLPERLHAARARRTTTLTWRLAAAAAGFLLLSGAFELLGAHRELAAPRAERLALRAEVQGAMTAREAIDGVGDRLAVLARAEATAPRWSAVLATVAERLPADAHLESFRGRGDSLALNGVAGRAAGVFEQLQHAPGIAAVRADAPIRQEAREGAPPLERFALSARLAPAIPPEAAP